MRHELSSNALMWRRPGACINAVRKDYSAPGTEESVCWDEPHARTQRLPSYADYFQRTPGYDLHKC